MATVNGLTAERMIELSNAWSQVAESHQTLEGFVGQISNTLGNVQAFQQDILNNHLPNVNQDLADAQVAINDLNETTLPNLVLDLDAANALIDSALQQNSDTQSQLDALNATTLPGLADALIDLETTIDTDVATQLAALDADLTLYVDGQFPITTAQITAGAVNSTILADGAVIQTKITDSAVVANKIAANAVIADKIAANAVIADKIAANAVVADKIAANAVVADKIAANAVTASKILAGSIQTNHMTANSIDADRLLANTITADKIAANAITATHLLIQGENMLTDPGFESGTFNYHQAMTGAEWLTENVSGTAARSGTRYARITVSGANGVPANSNVLRTGGSITNVTTSYHPRVSPGETIRYGFWIDATTGSTLTARVNLQVRSVSDTATNVASVFPTPEPIGVAGWIFVGGELTIPTSVADPNLYAVATLQLSGGAPGNIVRVDDLVLRRKLDGKLIVDGSITAQHITAAGLSAAIITSGFLSADRIDVNSISGAKLTLTVSLTSKSITGGEIIGTKFKTAASGTRLEINDDDEAGSIKGRLDDGAVTAPVLINPKMLGSGGSRRQTLYLSSGALGGGVARIEIRSGSADNTSWNPLINMDAETHFQNTTKYFGNLRVTSGQTMIYEGYIDGGVTGASVNDAGAFIRTGSSKRWKQEITPLTLKQAKVVLDMEAVSFQWKPEQQMGDRFQAGFTAEQAEQVGAELWLTRDGKGMPSGVRYGELTAAHNVIIKDQQYRIERLEALVRNLLQNSQNGSN